MTDNTRKLCVSCAWRVNFTKRFSVDDSVALHCPDYSEDITLRKSQQGPDAPLEKD